MNPVSQSPLYIKKLVYNLLIPLFLFLFLSDIYADTIPIRLHPDNPHFFEFRGEPTILVTSAEHYGALVNLDFDYVAYLDELYEKGNNYSRVFVGTFLIRNYESPLAPAPGRFIAPWARSEVDGFRYGGNKFDLDTWDTDYFDRLHDLVYQASERGIVLELTLFSVLYTNESWVSSPLNKRNNINGIGNCTKEEALTMENGNLMDYQKALVTKLVGELEGYDNLFFEIVNEPYIFDADVPNELDPELSQKFVHHDWQKEMVATINSAQAGNEHKFMIAQNIDQVSTVITENEGKITDGIEGVSIFNFHYNARTAGRINSSIGDNYHLNKVIACDETGYYNNHTQDVVYRKQAWNYIMAGGAIYNSLDFTFQVDFPAGDQENPVTNYGGGESLRYQLGLLNKFMRDLDFIEMDLNNDLPKSNGIVTSCVPETTQVRCLSIDGEDYALYIDSEVEGSVDLTFDLPVNEYMLVWYDVKQGIYFDTTYIDHFGNQLVISTPDFSEDIAMRIQINQVPFANAGEDVLITLPENTVQLNALGQDDGLPIGNSVEFQWSLFSGPNALTFNDDEIYNPIVTFGTDGSYVLKLITNDGEFQAEDYITIVVAPGESLAGCWPFDEESGTVAHDPLNSDNNGILMNGLSFDSDSEPSWHENALLFDGVDDYIRVDNAQAPMLNMGESDFTISLYMQWDSLWTDRMYFVSKTDGTKGYALRTDVQNTFSAVLFNGSKKVVKSISIPEIDAWNHLVAVFDRGNNLLSVYLNGEFENSVSMPDGNIDNEADFFIGAYNHPRGPRQFFSGMLDEVRIYDRTLSASEIFTIYNATRPNLAPNVDAGSDKVLFLPETVLSLEGQVDDDGLPVNGSMDFLWEKVSGPGHVLFSESTSLDVDLTFFAPGTYEISLSATDGLLTSIDTMSVEVYPQTDLIGHWTMDETTGIFAADNSSLDNMGELQDGMSFNTSSVEGKIGNALSFNGVENYVSMGDPADGSLDMGESDFSLSSWINIPQHNGELRTIINKLSGGMSGYSLRINEGNKLKAHFRTTSSNITCFSDIEVGEGEWHHVVAVFSRTTNKLLLYLDGVMIGEKGIGGGSLDNDFDFRIGANGSGSMVNSLMKGYIDDVKVYNIALSESQILNLYNGPVTHFGGGAADDNNATEETVGITTSTSEQLTDILTAYPNPFKGQSTVFFKMSKPGKISLGLYNSAGAQVVELYKGFVDVGSEHSLKYQINDRPNGFYYLILKQDGQPKIVRKVLLAR